ncbi:response regulator transcription factor [Actinoplanes sp. NPDC049265]|uniref:response regulator transcription factor n=1 Tax=Actinoplanes sp. NPDC049265 TaxID=3363902 RepID=UPI00371D0C0D
MPTLSPAAPAPLRPPTATCIVVVDDDEDIRELVAFKLRAAGYRTLTAADGDAGLELALRERPDLMILDVSMPGMDGLAVCGQVHRKAEMADLPVLILSARAMPYDIDLGLAVGADDYMTKPFSPAELLSRVDALLAGNRR